MAVGDRILELLQSRDMTQKQLAADLSLPLLRSTAMYAITANRITPP